LAIRNGAWGRTLTCLLLLTHRGILDERRLRHQQALQANLGDPLLPFSKIKNFIMQRLHRGHFVVYKHTLLLHFFYVRLLLILVLRKLGLPPGRRYLYTVKLSPLETSTMTYTAAFAPAAAAPWDTLTMRSPQSRPSQQYVQSQRPQMFGSTKHTVVSMAASKQPKTRCPPSPAANAGKAVPAHPFLDEDYVHPQGFTLFSEKTNGQLAMLGLVIGVATEVLSKDHVTIAGQIGMILAPVTSIFAVVMRELQALS
jgi:hypothetical protein